MCASPGTRLSRAFAWALTAAVATSIAAAPVAAQDEPAPADSAPPLYEDLVPSGPGFEQRLAEIQRRIQSAAVYPPIARSRNEAGEARIAFEIAPDGRPLKVRVARSSGSAVLDRAAERAVQRAAPLPRLFGEINVPVHFELTAPD